MIDRDELASRSTARGRVSRAAWCSVGTGSTATFVVQALAIGRQGLKIVGIDSGHRDAGA